MNKQKAWIWFKGGLKGGSWVAGFIASITEESEEVFLIEKSDFISCRVPSWRVRLEEPNNLNQGPIVPENAVWKYR